MSEDAGVDVEGTGMSAAVVAFGMCMTSATWLIGVGERGLQASLLASV